MPRLKKHRFTVVRKSTGRGGGRWPVKVHPVAVPGPSGVENHVLPEPSEERVELLEDDDRDVEDSEEVEIESRLPMMFCVVCYNEFTPYNLNCTAWETAMTKDFYLALNIPSGGQDEESILSLPFCPDCHSKVSVMFSVHQQLKNILQTFNCTRNDLAFSIVESIDKNCRNGPLDLIRQQIFERWKELYTIAQEKQTVDIFEAERDDYLDPALPVDNVWPADHKSMALASISKHGRSFQNERKKSKIMLARNIRGDIDMVNVVYPVNKTKSQSKKGLKLADFTSKGASKKLINGKVGRAPEMPKLEPMEKLPSKSGTTISTFRKTLNITKVNGSFGKKPSKAALLKQSLQKGKLQLMKKATGSSKATSLLKSLGNKKLTKKPAVKLADGSWKCPYCPKIYPDLTRVKRHQSISHDNHVGPLGCDMCTKRFSTALTLRRHLQVVHQQMIEGFAKCPYCKKAFGKKHAFELHIKNFHKGKTVPDYVPGSEPEITVKIPMVSPPSPEITDLESRTSSSPESSNAKRKQLSPSKRKSVMKTSIPKKKEKTEVPVKLGNGSQESTDEESQPIKSSATSKSVSGSKEELGKKEDLKSMTSTSCPTCKTDFGTEALLKSHMLICHDVNNKCMTCDLECSTESELREHSYTLHGKKGAECQVCGKWYAKPQSLGGHMHLHRREGITWEKTGGGGRKKSLPGLSSA